MSDEFDDAIADPALARAGSALSIENQRARLSAARLVSRLYAAASAPLRARMLACMLQPLGPLGIAAISAGAFGTFLHRRGGPGASVTLGEIGRYSSEQIYELARFVEQVSPESLRALAAVITDSRLGVAGFSASVAMMLMHVVRGRSADARRRSALN